MGVLDTVKNIWNAFSSDVNYQPRVSEARVVYGNRPPDLPYLRFNSERSILASVYTRIGIDVSSVPIRHVEIDEFGRYSKDSDSLFNQCLLLEANIDQAPTTFRQDIVTTLFDKGCAVIVPVDTTLDPTLNDEYDIMSLRVGEVVQWYPRHVKVKVYNEKKGDRQEVLLLKKNVAIIYNPLYSVMNEPNSTLQRLTRKLSLLDTVDEQSSSGKLDIIIQLPYVIKTDQRREQAEKRRSDIELQLKDSKYGIAYTDGTEKVTQLNRPAENNLLKQVEYLTNLLYSELGITPSIMDGTANEEAMLNYMNRTVEPILTAIVEGMQRAFVGKKGWENNKRIMYFRDLFKLVPIAQIAEIGDKFTRNEIVTSNEMRGFIGLPPSTDPKADQLVNSNMPQPTDPSMTQTYPSDTTDASSIMNDTLDSLSSDIDSILSGVQ